jgi:tRNA G26 N,N-dimethylase Trm1
MALIELKTRRKSYRCQHNSVVLDADSRLLECELCGTTLDAFGWMWDLTQRKENIEFNIRELMREAEEKKKALDAIRQELSRTKQKAKRAGIIQSNQF